MTFLLLSFESKNQLLPVRCAAKGEKDYQLDLVTPVISPRLASERKQIRQTPNFL